MAAEQACPCGHRLSMCHRENAARWCGSSRPEQELRETNRRLHRRVQEAESVAASINGQRIEALELELAEAKVERHKLRNENAFMKSERRRLQRELRATKERSED